MGDSVDRLVFGANRFEHRKHGLRARFYGETEAGRGPIRRAIRVIETADLGETKKGLDSEEPDPTTQVVSIPLMPKPCQVERAGVTRQKRTFSDVVQSVLAAAVLGARHRQLRSGVGVP